MASEKCEMSPAEFHAEYGSESERLAALYGHGVPVSCSQCSAEVTTLDVDERGVCDECRFADDMASCTDLWPLPVAS